ncbi:magnesium and cobalt transporter [Poseidonocella pacifica]|uniref:Magnesium and cobalt transporter n=1 Tax=Poseidonocella pacifica TaxID=871651 RepID=A0A1I0WDU4_9RHOB|nr:hemolysin family protein [Poseidonocella pacifica]SFA86892.1 magnesium and cobalt transporter [Poseidonocella pacifica]
MGDSTDESSDAAQSAQPEGQIDVPQGGFLRRLFGGTSETDETGEVNGAEQAPKPKATHGLFNLRRKRVEDVSIPKVEIVAVPSTITREDLVEVFRESGMSRLPVYKGTLDTPIGMVHLKDFALRHGFNGDSGRFVISKMLRPLLYVPPSMPLGVLLTKMQTERRHMALVIDEYGGVDGLVTIEDLIEQVVGEIEDEHDLEEDELWSEERPGCYLAQARTPLSDFETAIGMALTEHEDIDEEEIDTLGGLVFMLAGRVPARGEVVEHPSGVEFEVIDADPRRIKRMRVLLPDVPAA